MNMTHYMELLAANQPWNLILFMAIPVVLAESVAITELFILFARPKTAWYLSINRFASIAGGVYFVGVFGYLMQTAVLPLTASGEWRGPADMIAVGAYLAGIVPLAGMALLDLRIIGRGMEFETRLKWHACFVALFLVVAHVAMIFGMLDPALFSRTTDASMTMPGHGLGGHMH